MWSWVDAAGLPEFTPANVGESLEIAVDVPTVRDAGGIIGAARQRVAEFARPSLWGAKLQFPGHGLVEVVSAWVLAYEPGDFVGLHTDRPDSDLTGLVAIEGGSDPLVLCEDLTDMDPAALCAVAMHTPHPRGAELLLRQDAILLFRGSAVPHHRPPVTAASRVLSLSLVAT